MPEFPIRRNTSLLAGAMAMQSAALQLSAAMSSLTFALVTGISGLLGLGPALSMIAAAVTAQPAGRMMDRVGRVPVLVVGFLAGAVGCALLAIGSFLRSPLLAMPGFVLLGAAGATGALTRAAAGDMYAPAHRARGIAYVMFGSVFGAILGPTVFAPIFRGREVSPEALLIPWLAGGAMLLIAAVIVMSVRPDPKRIAEAIEKSLGLVNDVSEPAAPLAEILRRPGAASAVLASVVSFAVMATVMNLTGYVIVQHHHHAQHLVFPVIGAHVLGMYLLMPVVGMIVDRIGRRETLAAGLALLGFSAAGLTWLDSIVPIAILLFLLGLGWNASFVAATTQLVDLSTAAERGKLLGFNDFVAGAAGSVLVIVGGFALDTGGVAVLALGAGLVAFTPIPFIMFGSRYRIHLRQAAS
ncbi:MAG: MFS transporter [Longimicrobiales bacterium]